MKKLLSIRLPFSFLALFLVTELWQGPAMAQAETTGRHSLGIGAILGEPTGLTGKYWMDSRSAVDLGLAFSFNSFMLIYSDYLWHFPRAFSQKGSPSFVQELIPYVGIGGALFSSTNTVRVNHVYFTSGGSSVGLGFRIPLGIEWRPSSPRLGIFVEIVPGVGLIPGTFGFFEGGVGARFYF